MRGTTKREELKQREYEAREEGGQPKKEERKKEFPAATMLCIVQKKVLFKENKKPIYIAFIALLLQMVWNVVEWQLM